MFTFQLDENYCVTTIKEQLDSSYISKNLQKPITEKGIYFGLIFKGRQIGFSKLLTDFSDVAIIFDFMVDKDHKGKKISEKRMLEDTFLRIILKYPAIVRKPEFVFVFPFPKKEELFFHTKFHFTTNKSHEILIRTTSEKVFPIDLGKNIVIKKAISVEGRALVLELLRNNAYWAASYTSDRLQLLVENAECYCLYYEEKLVGFARVLTDYKNIASLWDVVIHKDYRNKGLGKILMQYVFSDSLTKDINLWVLNTDKAHNFYKKFGFMPTDEIKEDILISKIRLQTSWPSYSLDIKQLFFTSPAPKATLGIKDTETFLNTKRKGMKKFWLSLF